MVLRLQPGHVHNCKLRTMGFYSSTFNKAFELWQSNGFAPPGPPGNSGRSSAAPTRPASATTCSGGGRDGLGIRAFFLGTRILEGAPHAARGGAGAAPSPKTTTPANQRAHSHYLLHALCQAGGEQYRRPSGVPVVSERTPGSQIAAGGLDETRG